MIVCNRPILAFACSLSLLAVHAPTEAAELTIFATGSMADPLEALGEEFTRATGHTLRFSVGTTGTVLARLRAGETGDVIVISDEAAAALEEDGTIVAGTRRRVASSLFGVVVKATAPKPDVSSPEALAQTVLRARTIAYPDPVAAAVSGGYIESVFERMGIRDEAKKKASLKPMGYLVGEAVENGEVELGLSFISEFTANPALQVVRFPDALQRPQPYVAGIFSGTVHADAARAFIAFVTSADVREKLMAAGVDPAASLR
jgi:molybdate transport system substrate-binding protein